MLFGFSPSSSNLEATDAVPAVLTVHLAVIRVVAATCSLHAVCDLASYSSYDHGTICELDAMLTSHRHRQPPEFIRQCVELLGFALSKSAA